MWLLPGQWENEKLADKANKSISFTPSIPQFQSRVGLEFWSADASYSHPAYSLATSIFKRKKKVENKSALFLYMRY